MTKREKIIVVVMILTVIYGFYDLVLSKQFKKSKKAPAQAMVSTPVNGTVQMTVGDRKLVAEISSVLKEDETVKTNAYVAARADEEWKNAPFSAAHHNAGGGEETTVRGLDETRVIYNGYVEIGTKKVAIINGADYQVGDELEIGGYRVERIAKSSVILESERMGKKIRIPFIEEE